MDAKNKIWIYGYFAENCNKGGKYEVNLTLTSDQGISKSFQTRVVINDTGSMNCSNNP